jgi:hypothetical protein
MSWAIWSVRNDAIFRNIQPVISNAKTTLYYCIKIQPVISDAQVILRAKKSYEALILVNG